MTKYILIAFVVLESFGAALFTDSALETTGDTQKAAIIFAVMLTFVALVAAYDAIERFREDRKRFPQFPNGIAYYDGNGNRII